MPTLGPMAKLLQPMGRAAIHWCVTHRWSHLHSMPGISSWKFSSGKVKNVGSRALGANASQNWARWISSMTQNISWLIWQCFYVVPICRPSCILSGNVYVWTSIPLKKPEKPLPEKLTDSFPSAKFILLNSKLVSLNGFPLCDFKCVGESTHILFREWQKKVWHTLWTILKAAFNLDSQRREESICG